MAKTMRIAFPRGGTLPSEITGGKEKTVPPHEPVTVPHDYGVHLISDRFAYEAAAKKTTKSGTGETASTSETGIADLEKAVSDARAELEAASDLDTKGRAQAKLSEAERELEAARAAGGN